MAQRVDSLTIKVIGKDDGAISADSFLKIIQETIALLRDFDRERSLVWKVTSASMQSPLSMTFSAELHGDSEPPPVRPSQRYRELFGSLDSGKSPRGTTTKALLRASKLVDALNNGVAKIVITAPGLEPLAPTQRVQATVSEFIESRRKDYTDQTTLEGDLKTVSVAGGSKFYIFDRLTGHQTLCSIPHDKLEQAKALLERRVWVTGRVKFKGEIGRASCRERV